MDDKHRPGELIVPHGPEAPSPENPAVQETSAATEKPADTPAPVIAEPVNDGPLQPVPDPVGPDPVSQDGWFRQEPPDDGRHEPLPEGLSWTSSEFIAHDKGIEWYGLLALAGAVAATLMYLLTKDVISTVIVVFAIVAFGGIAGRKPRVQRYDLTGQGLQIGQKFYDLQDFRTFSVVEEGAIASIVLNPLKRFMPPLTIYVAPELEQQVIDFMSAYLPFEKHKADAVDSLLKRIRF